MNQKSEEVWQGVDGWVENLAEVSQYCDHVELWDGEMGLTSRSSLPDTFCFNLVAVAFCNSVTMALLCLSYSAYLSGFIGGG